MCLGRVKAVSAGYIFVYSNTNCICVKQRRESFKIWSAFIRINTGGEILDNEIQPWTINDVKKKVDHIFSPRLTTYPQLLKSKYLVTFSARIPIGIYLEHIFLS